MHAVVDDLNSLKPRLGLFGGYGIELEYMIVDRASLVARPISDLILRDSEGNIVNELELMGTCWSNELVMHVLEIKSRGPSPSLIGLKNLFQSDIKRINSLLAQHHAMLLPTGMHPFFDPDRETKLWSHEQNDIYEAYHQIFNCRGHGWSNLQSMHINLPFADSEEFGMLHAAIRLVLPLLQALAASSPVCEREFKGFLDQRLEFYQRNQRAIKEIAGEVVPEQVFSIQDYHEQILDPMFKAIRPYDPKGILQGEWLNSRGAIARFERNAIEIRLIDTQESPKMDLAIASAVVSLIKSLVEERWVPYSLQKQWSASSLFEIFKKITCDGDRAKIDNIAFLQIFDPKAVSPMQAQELWRHIIDRLIHWGGYPVDDFTDELQWILKHGCLARRILKALGNLTAEKRDHKKVFELMDIQKVYFALARALAKGESFDPTEFAR